MATVPYNKATLGEYCLRKLGSPVIQINVSDDQISDRIDDALQLYIDHHCDGTQKVYYKVQVTDAMKAKKYITLPENIVGVVRIFPISSAYSMGTGMFSLEYQYMMANIWDIGSVEMAPYYMTMQNLQLIEQLLVGQQPIRFNRHVNKLNIDMNWNKIATGNWLLIEAYQSLDPDEFTDVWNDRWLKEYATALIKREWGEILTKFRDQQLPGGMKFNGERILSDAQADVKRLEEDIIFNYGGVLEHVYA